MTENRVEMEVTAEPALEDLGVLSNGIDEFNGTTALAGDRAKVALAVFLRRNGGIVGGAAGDTHYGWLYLSLLWVEEAHRGAGWGRRLVERFETEALGRGCRRAWVDTYGFQAPGFYERLGYQEFGRLDDFPPGSARHFFWKALSG